MLVILCAGPTLKFYCDSVVALSGAEFKADVDGEPVPFWTSIHIKAGATLSVGTVSLSCAAVVLVGGTELSAAVVMASPGEE